MVQQAVDMFGTVYLGLALPDFVVPSEGDWLTIPWTLPPQSKGNTSPNPNNGHCVPIVGYDVENLYIVTWGVLKAMNYAFYNTYVDEAFAVLSPDWIEKTGEAPPGLNLSQLLADIKQV